MSRARAPWIRSAPVDLLLALAWLPFAATALWFRGDGNQLFVLLSALLAFSFVHQPLTLALVYGDREQFVLRRRLFVIGPLVLAAVIALGLTISFTLVAVVAGLWNMEHTLMQRFGFVRIYGRRTGETDGRLERALLLSWLISTLLWVAADGRIEQRVAALPIGQLNSSALDVLTSARPYAIALLIPCIAIVMTLTGRWIATEWARVQTGTANRPKQFYIASTAAMFALAALVDPVAGFAGFAGAHAVEYFFIVDHRLATTRPAASRWRFFAGYLATFEVFYLLAHDHQPFFLWVVLFLGGLHFLFDGVIWKSRPRIATQPIAANANA